MNRAASSIQALIFDFDGTLVDTMPLHFEAYRRVLAEVDIELSAADFYGSIGGNARETIPKFLRGRPCRLSSEEIHARKKAVVSELFQTRPIPVLETAQLLELFAGRFKTALASSGSRAGIEQVLRRLGWMEYFDAIVAGEDVSQGKPAPDLFLLAARKLSVEPHACLVFEDTEAGVAGARHAGMRVFDVRATTPSSRVPQRQ